MSWLEHCNENAPNDLMRWAGYNMAELSAEDRMAILAGPAATTSQGPRKDSNESPVQSAPSSRPMGFGEAINSIFSKLTTFEGRARRSEYWYYVLLNLPIAFVLYAIDDTAQGQPGALAGIYTLLSMIFGLSLTVRRLHDTDNSGWLILLMFIPVLGLLIMLAYACVEGTDGDNQYGPDPKLSNESSLPIPSAQSPSMPTARTSALMGELEKLSQMRAMNLLTESEYMAAKRKLIGS